MALKYRLDSRNDVTEYNAAFSFISRIKHPNGTSNYCVFNIKGNEIPSEYKIFFALEDTAKNFRPGGRANGFLQKALRYVSGRHFLGKQQSHAHARCMNKTSMSNKE